MKRLIAMLLALTIFATFFAGLAVNVSAASNEWKIYNEYGYYDAEEKVDYHVVISVKESCKKILWVKNYYISQMKVDAYVTTLNGNKATVDQKTCILPKNSKIGINTCMDYIEKCCPSDLRNAYQKVLEDQELYRTFYLWEEYGSSVPKKYLAKYEEFVRKKSEGYLKDTMKEALGITLPACLEPLSAASSVQGDAEELRALCEYIICDWNNLIWRYWDYRVDNIRDRGIPSVKDLLDKTNDHATSSQTSRKSLRDDKSVELADGIYTHSLS